MAMNEVYITMCMLSINKPQVLQIMEWEYHPDLVLKKFMQKFVL